MSHSGSDETEKASHDDIEYTGKHIPVVKNVEELGSHYPNQSTEPRPTRLYL
jgi:hypothetical protein